MIRYLERRLIDLRPERHCAWADLKDLPPLRALARAKSRSGRMPRNLKLPHGHTGHRMATRADRRSLAFLEYPPTRTPPLALFWPVLMLTMFLTSILECLTPLSEDGNPLFTSFEILSLSNFFRVNHAVLFFHMPVPCDNVFCFIPPSTSPIWLRSNSCNMPYYATGQTCNRAFFLRIHLLSGA